MQINRRNFLTAAGAATLTAGCVGARAQVRTKAPGPRLAELDRVAGAPVLKRELFPSPVMIDFVQLLKRDKDYLVHVRSKDGAEGVSLVNPPRGPGLAVLFKQSVVPFFVGKDARDLGTQVCS